LAKKTNDTTSDSLGFAQSGKNTSYDSSYAKSSNKVRGHQNFQGKGVKIKVLAVTKVIGPIFIALDMNKRTMKLLHVT